MKHLEIHILQSVPVSCLNRDDLGSPKTAYFGGVKRARVSSQCWKRAIRKYASELAPELFNGIRTKSLAQVLSGELSRMGIDCATESANELVKAIITKDGDKDSKDKSSKDNDNKKEAIKSDVLLYISRKEIQTLAEEFVHAFQDKSTSKNAVKNAVTKLLKSKDAFSEDSADIALFGRMLAAKPIFNVEGAAMFGHALSTHRVDTEPDYFTAIDDLRPADRTAAEMVETLEFQSATYYRFAAINLDLLADEHHLKRLDGDTRKEIVGKFVEAVLKAIPQARQNSMNGNTLPGYVLAVYRDKGHPVQLVNAFERPVRCLDNEGLLQASIKAIRDEKANLQNLWGLDYSHSVELSKDSQTTFDQFIEEVQSYVS